MPSNILATIIVLGLAGVVSPAAASPDEIRAAAHLDLTFAPGGAADEVSPGMLPETQSASATLDRFGAEGTRRWMIHGSYIDNTEGANGAIGGVGFEWFLKDDISVNLEFNGFYTSQPVEDAAGFHVNLLFRWHFMTRDTWSLFIDGGAGFLLTDNEVPASGTDYNFTPQAGAGISFDLKDDMRMLLGVRWHHISNANLDANNPGRDSYQVWAGLSCGF